MSDVRDFLDVYNMNYYLRLYQQMIAKCKYLISKEISPDDFVNYNIEYSKVFEYKVHLKLIDNLNTAEKWCAYYIANYYTDAFLEWCKLLLKIDWTILTTKQIITIDTIIYILKTLKENNWR